MQTVISTWKDITQQVFPIFTIPGTEIFSRLMTGWILCTARKTITGIFPFADPCFQRAHDAYHRFFPDCRWDINKLWQILALTLLKLFCPAGIITVALDDTLFHHTARKINGAGYWRDAIRSTKRSIVYAWGLNLVVLTLQIQPPWGGEPLGLPINITLHRQKANPSFTDALCCLRRELWVERIKYMFGNSAVHDKKFEFLLEALAPAA
jgi:hypothetical protein